MQITKKFTFDSAHQLPSHPGKCKNLHGHTYTLFVTIEGEVDSNTGMVMDFGDLDRIVKEKVIDVLDHSLLNERISIPTAENIAVWIWEKIKVSLSLSKIEVWETPESCATYFG